MFIDPSNFAPPSTAFQLKNQLESSKKYQKQGK